MPGSAERRASPGLDAARARGDPQRDRMPVTVRTGIRSGPPPAPGYAPLAYAWDDVLREDPPPKLTPGERTLALLGREDADADVMLTEVVLVRALVERG